MTDTDEADDTTAADRDDMLYERGSRAALMSMLRHVLQQLGCDDPEAGRVRWLIEREEAVAALRDVCDEFGDNEWERTLSLGDVIIKHLRKHLESP